MCECTYNFIHKRTVTSGFWFCSISLRDRVHFGLGCCTLFTFRFRLVLVKTWVLVRFVLAGFRFYRISSFKSSETPCDEGGTASKLPIQKTLTRSSDSAQSPYVLNQQQHSSNGHFTGLSCEDGGGGVCLFVCLRFNGTFSTNRLYHTITVG